MWNVKIEFTPRRQAKMKLPKLYHKDLASEAMQNALFGWQKFLSFQNL